MKSEYIILESLENVDEKFIDEASENTPKLGKRNSISKLLLVAIIIVMCMAFVVPTFSTVVRKPDELLFALFPTIAQKLKPIQMSCEDEGILMEVISADVTDTEANIFISLTDIEGDRLDSTTDLFDSYDIRRPFDSSATCTRVSFDAETKTVTYLISIDWHNTVGVLGSKVTFSLGEILTNKQKYEGYLNGIDLSKVYEAESTMKVDSIRGGSYDDENMELLDEDDVYLKPNNNGIADLPVDEVKLTGMGYIDGKLRIQCYFKNIFEYDNHGYILLVDENGNRIHGEQSVSFWDSEGCGSYDETVYDITPEELSKCRLYGYFVTCDTNIDGDWEVTFELKD